MHPEHRKLLAQADQLQRAGHLAQAEAICRRIVAEDPNFGDGWNTLGVIAYNFGKPQAALEHFIRARNSAPTNAGFQCNVGSLLKTLGRQAEAEPVLR